jgi:hypothetical protein
MKGLSYKQKHGDLQTRSFMLTDEARVKSRMYDHANRQCKVGI